MSDYNEPAYRQPPRESLYPDPPPGYGQRNSGQPSLSLRRTPRYSRASNPSWVSNPMLSPPTFGQPSSSTGSRPLPAPSPVPSRIMSEFAPTFRPPSDLGPEPEAETYTVVAPETREEREWERETEYMTTSVNEEDDGYLHYQEPQGQVPPEIDPRAYPLVPEPEYEPKSRRFVGGFVAGLKGLGKLPKAVVKSHFYDRKSTRKGAPGTEQPTGPLYYLPPSNPPESSAPEPASTQPVEDIGTPKPSAELSPLNTNLRTSQPRSSSSHASLQFRTSIRSPEAVEPLPASDYKQMEPPIGMAPPDDSFSVHITRVHKFFQELKDLPWTSERVALDYFPEESNRAHVGKAKPSKSWYTVRGHQDLDLLAGPAPPSARTATIQLQRGDDRATVASVRSASRPRHDGRSPASYTTSPGVIPSPGASSHGHGQHAMSYSYYFAPPQPLYVYSAPMTSPMTHRGTSSSSSSMSPEAHQAVPVYMMAGPPPGLIATPPPVVHASSLHHPSRAVSPSLTTPPGQLSSHQRHSGSNAH